MDLKNKVAIVTGGATGIGKEIANSLLENGIQNVAILDTDIAKGKETIDELNNKYGKGKAVLIITDVTKNTNFEDAFELAISTFGRLDIVVNNAGLLNEIDYEYMININLTGVIRGTKLAIKHMSKTDNGSGGIILNIASIAGLSSCHPMPVYAATKAGVVNFVTSYGHPYHCEEKGINIMALCPGFTVGTSFILDIATSLTEEDMQEAMKCGTTLKPQTPDCVGRAAVHVIQNGTTGSVWVIEGGDLFEANVPERSTYQKLLKENI